MLNYNNFLAFKISVFPVQAAPRRLWGKAWGARAFVSVYEAPRCPFLWFQLQFLFCVANFLERRHGWVTSLPSPLSLQRHSLWGWKRSHPTGRRAWAPGPPSMGSQLAKVRVDGESWWPWAVWRLRQEEVVLGFAPVPNHPNQSSRGPPCGASQEQPHKWCPAPTLFA